MESGVTKRWRRSARGSRRTSAANTAQIRPVQAGFGVGAAQHGDLMPQHEQLNEARASVLIPDVDVLIGTGTDWDEAVNNIAWESGDMLLLGSGAAGPLAQVFLGSAASKILRHAPVPVMIVPRPHTSSKG